MRLTAPDPPLTDGVVVLKPLDEKHLEAIGRCLTDTEIVKWFGAAKVGPQEFLVEKQHGWHEGSAAWFAVCDQSNTCVGESFLFLGDAGIADIGYWLLSEGRGRGFATRATRLLSRWALATLGVERLQLWI